jgi:(p)ppGpp synthase/HD superfamily hydrolase
MQTHLGYSEPYEHALRLAATAHRQQNRKGCDIPYITHPFHVSVILLRHGFPTDAEIVAALSERKTDAQGAKRPWEIRKREGLEHMRNASLEAAAVKVADTLHNAHSTALDVRREGPHIWQRFNRGPEQSLNYYRQILQIARQRLHDHPLVDERADVLDDLTQLADETTHS